MKILEEKMKCIKCNKTIPDESAFCLYCGSKVENESTHRITKPRKITIERASSFVGCAAVYQIICDGQVIASIRNGETKVFEIDEKSHIIQCCITSPTMIYGNGTGGVYGGGGTTVSDVVNIPSGTQSADLFVKNGFASLRLKLVRLY